MSDLIYRQDAISREFVEIEISHPKFTSKEHKGNPYYAIKYIENGEEYVGYGTYKPEVLSQYLKEYFMPSAKLEPKCNSCRYRNLEWYEEPCDSCTMGGESCHYKPEPERLTDDDFETIRIHLNALKERLCNQRRWKEAEDYERLINRFISFASAQPEHLVKESGDLVKDLVNDCINRQDAIDALLTGKEFLMRVLDDADVVGQEREKFSWRLGLIESFIDDINELPSAEPEEE